MSLNDRRRWRIPDPRPGVALDAIEPVPVRARALLSRSVTPVSEESFVQVWGAASMLMGLHYHQVRFIEGAEEDCSSPPFDLLVPRNEAVAWVNRVGQLRYFIKSQLVTEALGPQSTPAIDEVLPFRMKHTAHRSVDSPRKEDTLDLQLSQAIAFSELAGAQWAPRPGVQLPPNGMPSFTTHFITFQMRVSESERRTLNLEIAHPQVMAEGYTVLASLLEAGDA
jgi:hypothetical protein